MTFKEFMDIHQANLPFDKGGMFKKGVKYLDTPLYYMADYDVNTLPYIIYQEKGFIHWITKKKVVKNIGFITVKTVGHLNKAIYSESLGLPYPTQKKFSDSTAQRNNSLLLSQGGMSV